MHTTRLCTSGVFSTTTMWSPSGPSNPSSPDRRRPVGEEALLVSRIGPGPGNHFRAVHRAEVVFEVPDDRVDRFGVEQALLDEHRFDCGDPGLDRRQFRWMVVVRGHRGSSR